MNEIETYEVQLLRHREEAASLIGDAPGESPRIQGCQSSPARLEEHYQRILLTFQHPQSRTESPWAEKMNMLSQELKRLLGVVVTLLRTATCL
jgi:hypothetical protein